MTDDMKTRAETVSVPTRVHGLTGVEWAAKVIADPMRTLPPGAGYLIAKSVGLGVRHFQLTNANRAMRWHGTIDNWSGLEWAGAMCGEAGEAANVAKKLRRLELGLEGNQYSERQIQERGELITQLGVECADAFAYLVLLCSRYGVDLEMHAIQKFNKVSEQMGFPERL